MANIESVTSQTNIVQYMRNVEFVCEKNNRSLFAENPHPRVHRSVGNLARFVYQWSGEPEVGFKPRFPTGTVGPHVQIFLYILTINDGFYLCHPHTINEFFFLLPI